MKTIIITYSNGDVERSQFNVHSNDMIHRIIDGSFRTAWHSKDKDGNFIRVTNMMHVRSIEIVEEDDAMED